MVTQLDCMTTYSVAENILFQHDILKKKTWSSVQIRKDVQGPLFGNYTRITQIVLDFHLKTGYFI